MLVVQFRMARAALGWGIVEFAERAGVSTNTIVRFERGEELKQSTVDQLRFVFEEAGLEFIPENGGGVGVRFTKPRSNSN
ncbi:helix-turn-helix domain-containing protein [Rhizobium wenxiniae]|uniref:helix-turn-helix domain-containing protein n=1 Tax=Rhizobium wenxiniae TaxID=1737357 RepID=UPI003C17139C